MEFVCKSQMQASLDTAVAQNVCREQYMKWWSEVTGESQFSVGLKPALPRLAPTTISHLRKFIPPDFQVLGIEDEAYAELLQLGICDDRYEVSAKDVVDASDKEGGG